MKKLHSDYYSVNASNEEIFIESKVTKTTYDYTNFNGTVAEMKEEAIKNMNTYSNEVNEVVRLVNEIRSEVSAPPLTLNKDLTIMAMMRAMEMTYGDYFSHWRPNGDICFSVGDEYGYNFYGENIAGYRKTPASVVEAWKNSIDHYTSMVNTSYTEIGVGFLNFDGNYNWVQLFR